jgi:pimeloyl-ACP methyl ester carboxylesterase
MFLQHGILDSADCWIMNFPSLAPAFVLAAEGYDVWLGNSRGSRYSMEHEYLDPKKDKEFWEFSFTEMGEYDAPAQFEYALKISEQKKATFIAHSQGTSQMFYALSAHPHYWKDKINLFVALAPVALMTHSRDLLFTFASNNLELFKFASNTAHVYSILEPGLPTAVTKIFCSFAGPICNLL